MEMSIPPAVRRIKTDGIRTAMTYRDSVPETPVVPVSGSRLPWWYGSEDPGHVRLAVLRYAREAGVGTVNAKARRERRRRPPHFVGRVARVASRLPSPRSSCSSSDEGSADHGAMGYAPRRHPRHHHPRHAESSDGPGEGNDGCEGQGGKGRRGNECLSDDDGGGGVLCDLFETIDAVHVYERAALGPGRAATLVAMVYFRTCWDDDGLPAHMERLGKAATRAEMDRLTHVGNAGKPWHAGITSPLGSEPKSSSSSSSSDDGTGSSGSSSCGSGGGSSDPHCPCIVCSVRLCEHPDGVCSVSNMYALPRAPMSPGLIYSQVAKGGNGGGGAGAGAGSENPRDHKQQTTAPIGGACDLTSPRDTQQPRPANPCDSADSDVTMGDANEPGGEDSFEYAVSPRAASVCDPEDVQVISILHDGIRSLITECGAVNGYTGRGGACDGFAARDLEDEVTILTEVPECGFYADCGEVTMGSGRCGDDLDVLGSFAALHSSSSPSPSPSSPSARGGNGIASFDRLNNDHAGSVSSDMINNGAGCNSASVDDEMNAMMSVVASGGSLCDGMVFCDDILGEFERSCEEAFAEAERGCVFRCGGTASDSDTDSDSDGDVGRGDDSDSDEYESSDEESSEGDGDGLGAFGGRLGLARHFFAAGAALVVKGASGSDEESDGDLGSGEKNEPRAGRGGNISDDEDSEDMDESSPPQPPSRQVAEE